MANLRRPTVYQSEWMSVATVVRDHTSNVSLSCCFPCTCYMLHVQCSNASSSKEHSLQEVPPVPRIGTVNWECSDKCTKKLFLSIWLSFDSNVLIVKKVETLLGGAHPPGKTYFSDWHCLFWNVATGGQTS